jgi:glutamate N-acetyltransferase/amino-acid N-acetyltransferase
MLKKALTEAAEASFNMISVDGDTSTNDTFVILANGLAGNAEISAEGKDYDIFKSVLFALAEYLARKMAKDGEGATKLIECRVSGAETVETARVLARSVIHSPLVKAAMFGCDANWGRIICAMGYSGADFDPEAVNIGFESDAGNITVAKAGHGISVDEALATEILKAQEVVINVSAGNGSGCATAWGCDLSYDYVKINGDYRS